MQDRFNKLYTFNNDDNTDIYKEYIETMCQNPPHSDVTNIGNIPVNLDLEPELIRKKTKPEKEEINETPNKKNKHKKNKTKKNKNKTKNKTKTDITNTNNGLGKKIKNLLIAISDFL